VIDVLCQQSTDADGSIEASISLLLAVADALHEQTVDAIYAPLGMFAFFIIYRLCTPYTAVTLRYRRLFAYVDCASSAGRPTTRERLPHRPVHAPPWHRTLLWVRSSVSARGAVHYDYVLHPGDPLAIVSVLCTSKRALFQWIDDLWNAMSSTMKLVSEGKPGLDQHSRDSDASTLPLYESMTHSALAALAAIQEGRFETSSPCNRKRRVPQGVQAMRYAMLLGNAVPLVASERG